jgi:hypothetical protein
LTGQQREELKQRLRRTDSVPERRRLNAVALYDAGQRMLVILDRHGIHTAEAVGRFVEAMQGRVQLLWLPTC